MKSKIKIGVALSGGVDSSTAMYLLIQKGYEPVGITLKLFDDNNSVVEKAKKICDKLNVEHIVVECQDIFKKTIKDYFANEYLNGRTPNPCVLCNQTIKWNLLLNELEKRGIHKIATGHYVKRKFNKSTNRYEIHKANDENKDQSYFLWKLSQDYLSRTIFPLSEYSKDEIKKIASKHNLIQPSESESQDICFLPNIDYRQFLENNYKSETDKIGEGKFVDEEGNVLGIHNGYHNFTIGQRRGLNIAVGHRIFVKEIIPQENKIVLATKDKLQSNQCILKDINFVSIPNCEKERLVTIKIRYRHKGINAKIIQKSNSEIIVTFLNPAEAVTPGQSGVFYDGEILLGGGIISNN